MLQPENNQAYNELLGWAGEQQGEGAPAAADLTMTEEEYQKFAYFADYA